LCTPAFQVERILASQNEGNIRRFLTPFAFNTGLTSVAGNTIKPASVKYQVIVTGEASDSAGDF
jgi:hypothetical protein